MQLKPFSLRIDCYTSGCKTWRLSCSAREFNISFLKKQHKFCRCSHRFHQSSNQNRTVSRIPSVLGPALLHQKCERYIAFNLRINCFLLPTFAPSHYSPQNREIMSQVGVNRVILFPCRLKIPLILGYKHRITLTYSFSSLNSAPIMESILYGGGICVGWAEGPLAPSYELLDQGAITSTYT